MYKFIFVADLFADQYPGGAELTSEALIANRPDVRKIKSQDLTKDFIVENKGKTWIFGNFVAVPAEELLYIIKNKISYHIVEYDFKLCKYRSPGKHIYASGKCECTKESHGKLMSLFFHNAVNIWFMSEKQSLVYKERMPFLALDKMRILSSIFDKNHLKTMQMLNKNVEKTNEKYLILGSGSWIKGTDDCIAYAKSNNLKYEVISGLPYEKMLQKIRQSRGLIFLPKAFDTCPRIVIEAKILKCELILNDNVLHKDEKWFKDGNIIKYLNGRVKYFWKEVTNEQ